MITITDIHSHCDEPRRDAIISTTPACFNPTPQQYYSLGIHPWESSDVDEMSLQQLALLAQHPQVVALGETGIDRLRGADVETQKKLFINHITLSEQLHKPLILHVVKGVDIVLSLHN
ncbi:MAG: TatD family hydrolase, partial [Bacteroidaceae bacterium]|nr:TatD family hydrolase [Bacteroidaceae bacterium]